MTTKNYFETDLGFQLTAHEANNVLIALVESKMNYKKEGLQSCAEDVDLTLRKIAKQLEKYKNL